MIFKFFSVIFKCLVLLFLTFIPKKKNVWVFGSWFGKNFSDNSKYFYLYINSMESSVIPIWITKDKKVVSKLRSRGFKAYYYKSIKGIYYQSVSSVAFVSHSISSDLNSWFISYQTKRIQLWHGVPLKKIGYDDREYTNPNKLSLRWLYMLDLLRNNFYSLAISSDMKCKQNFMSAFNLTYNQVEITGFPRSDCFSDRRYLKGGDEAYRVIYMPTFRKGDSNLFSKQVFDIFEIDKFLVLNNIILHVRIHPANQPDEQTQINIKKCNNVSLSTVEDIYEVIDTYDTLITDYSSIMFDFALSGRPIILSAIDIEEYLLNERAMYFDYVNIFKNRLCYDWNTILDRIVLQKNGASIETDDYLTSFNNDFKFNGASKNVYKWLQMNGL
jgi:CDP-glycerol glycerophosphotransferase (TagB/SpsB family)